MTGKMQEGAVVRRDIVLVAPPTRPASLLLMRSHLLEIGHDCNAFYALPREAGDASWKESVRFDSAASCLTLRFLFSRGRDADRFNDRVSVAWGDRAGVAVRSPAVFAPELHENVDASHCLRWESCDEACAAVVDLKGFRVGAKGAAGVARAIAKLKCDFSVKLRYGGIDDRDAAALAEVIGGNGSLTAIDLPLNQIGDQGALVLAELLGPAREQELQKKKKIKLRRVDLSNNAIGARGITAFAEALRVNRTLLDMNLTSNGIGDAGVVILAEALKINGTLTRLGLLNNGISGRGATAALSEALKVNKALTDLDLSGNDIGDDGTASLVDGLGANTSLTRVDLSGNDIASLGAAAVASALARNRSIRSLELAGNEIGAAGAKALADALGHNRTLTMLDLCDSEIGTEGAVAIADALRINVGLKMIDLGANGVGDDGAAALAAALAVNRSLSEIYLVSNNIGPAGARAIAAMLGGGNSSSGGGGSGSGNNNSVISDLSLAGNRIGDIGAVAVAQALIVNKTLTKLRLGGFSDAFGALGVCALTAAVEGANGGGILVPLTASQRLAFVMGHFRPCTNPSIDRRDSFIRRLPMDVIKRILLGYKVAQGRREFSGGVADARIITAITATLGADLNAKN